MVFRFSGVKLLRVVDNWNQFSNELWPSSSIIKDDNFLLGISFGCTSEDLFSKICRILRPRLITSSGKPDNFATSTPKLLSEEPIASLWSNMGSSFSNFITNW